MLIKTGNLVPTDLDPGDAFVVEAGHCGVWVWLGKYSSQVRLRECCMYVDTIHTLFKIYV